MKTLYIVRHGESSMGGPELKDQDRTLLQTGKQQTVKIAKFLESRSVKPDIIISSTATRAYETSKIIADFVNYSIEDITKDKSIYNSDVPEVLELLYGLDNSTQSAMIFGHNPTFTFLANKFLHDPIEFLPPTGVVSLNFDTQKWEDIMLAERETNFVIYPKML